MSKSSLAIAALPADSVAALSLLGQRLQLARKRRDWSLAELAGLARISAQTAAKIERGEPSVALRLVFAVMLAMDIGLDVEELVRLEDPNEDAREQRRSLEILVAGRQFTERPLILLQRLGARLRAKRKARKITINHMANCMYASPVTVRQLEKGSPSVSLGIAAAALACLRHSGDIQKLALPEKDRIAMSLDSLKQSQRKLVRRKILR
jgi:transcriptional regulator with XRE-family HTH domain